MTSTRAPSQVRTGQPDAREQAARAAGKHQQENHHRQRIGGMAEEQYEALNEGNLDQDVSQSHGDEIKQGKRRLAHCTTS